MDDVATSTKPPCFRDDATEVVRRLRGEGHVAYFAGGCVRDLLLGLEPKDYDVATDAHPAKVRSLFRQTQAVGQAFGVILVRLGKSVVEVATFRSDGRYLDGRRPEEVRFTTAEEDAKRRDFTINGLFLDPLDGDRVIDHVGGRADLDARLLRAIGQPEARFEEDHLRLLRAVRFASRFGLTYEAQTAKAIGHHAPQLTRISPERIGEELRLMLSAPTKHRAFAALREFGLWEIVLRFIKRPAGAGVDAMAHVRPERATPFALSLAAAITSHYWPDGEGREIFDKRVVREFVHGLRTSLRFSNDVSDGLEGTLEGVGVLLTPHALSVAQKKRFLARPTAGLSRELLAALAACGQYQEHAELLEADLAELEQTEFAPLPLVTGDDLTAAGLKPGPAFKRILDAVYDAQLEGRVTTKEDGMGMALGMA